MAAEHVLDVGCGTGELLRLARGAGHAGRLCGLDPAEAMLDVARRRPDVEWVLGDLTTAGWDRAFDLAVMTGHAFQVFLEDEELRTALKAIHSALAEDGRFVFETRNPPVRAWETWPAEGQIVHNGVPISARAVGRPAFAGERLTFATVYASPAWEGPETSQSTLRFLGEAALQAFLAEAGLAIETQYGDWDGSALSGTSPEIITVARRRRAAKRQAGGSVLPSRPLGGV